MSIQAMKQALEALEEIKSDTFHPAKVFKHNPAITALRAAIEAQEKCEPVAPEHGTMRIGDTLYHTLGGYLMGEVEKCEPVATVKIVEHLPDELEMLAVFHPPFAVSDGTKLFTHPAPVPAGMVLVPVEPTPEMIRASWDLASVGMFPDGTKHYISIAYKAMLAAAPQQEK